MKILLLTKKEHSVCHHAEKFTQQCFSDIKIFRGTPNSYERDELMWWEGDCIFSFLSPWIVPKSLLRRAKYAINWHPAPLEYPGLGGYNFALYNGDTEYGYTCHAMAPKVDSGKIYEIDRFPIFPNDTVESLLKRTHQHLLNHYIRSIENFSVKGTVAFDHNFYPNLGVTWKCEPYTRKDFETLREVTLDMSEDEIERRIKATTFPGHDGAYVKINGRKYQLQGGMQ